MRKTKIDIRSECILFAKRFRTVQHKSRATTLEHRFEIRPAIAGDQKHPVVFHARARKFVRRLALTGYPGTQRGTGARIGDVLTDVNK